MRFFSSANILYGVLMHTFCLFLGRIVAGEVAEAGYLVVQPKEGVLLMCSDLYTYSEPVHPVCFETDIHTKLEIYRLCQKECSEIPSGGAEGQRRLASEATGTLRRSLLKSTTNQKLLLHQRE